MGETNAATNAPLTASQAHAQIRDRLADADSTKLTDAEYRALDVLDSHQGTNHRSDATDTAITVANGQIGLTSHYLLHVDDTGYISLTHHGGDSGWTAVQAGEATVAPVTLAEDFETEAPVDEETVRSAYEHTAEELWPQIVTGDPLAFAWDGTHAYVELMTPREGLEATLRQQGVDLTGSEWETLHDDVEAATASIPRSLSASMFANYAFHLDWS